MRSNKFGAFRAAGLAYLVVLIVAFGGIAANAYWGITGTVSAKINVANWQTSLGAASKLTCSLSEESGAEGKNLLVEITGNSAQKHRMTLFGSAGTIHEGNGNTAKIPWKMLLEQGEDKFVLAITPQIAGADAQPVYRKVTITKNPQGVSCDPYS